MERARTARERPVKQARILLPLPTYGFDPTEAAIPWKILTARGHEVLFATPSGGPAEADRIMLTGERLGIFKPVLMARADAVEAYRVMENAEHFRNPVPWAELDSTGFDALFLPGGHDKGVREYLESPVLQRLVAEFLTAGKPVGAVCHGVLLAARSTDPATGHSVLVGRSVTTLLRSQELLAWNLTRLWLGDYYLTYPGHTVEEEVRAALGPDGRFLRGPIPLLRDDPRHLGRGFTVRDHNIVTARWPGDAHNLSLAFARLLREPV